MATANALDRQPPTFQQAVFIDGLVTIIRTTGCEATTGRKNPPECFLIQSNKRQSQPLHCTFSNSKLARVSNSATARSTSLNEALPVEARARNTISQPPVIFSSLGRTASLINRRVLTRFTAPPTRRLATAPTRTRFRSLANTTKTSQRLAHD